MTLKAKVGDTFSLACTRTDAAGDAVSLTGVTIAAQLRRGSTAVDLVPAPVDAAAGIFTLTKAAADTASWQLGIWSCDVEFTAGGIVASSETFNVLVEEDVTRAA